MNKYLKKILFVIGIIILVYIILGLLFVLIDYILGLFGHSFYTTLEPLNLSNCTPENITVSVCWLE